jgi:Coenzyme PQQ synthesis protein D (PqqD)
MYRVSARVRSTRNQDGAIVLDIPHGRILRLNTTASLIFESLQQARTESQIIDALVREFNISQEIAQTDVRQFLESLDQHGLVSYDASEMHS